MRYLQLDAFQCSLNQFSNLSIPKHGTMRKLLHFIKLFQKKDLPFLMQKSIQLHLSERVCELQFAKRD